MLCMWVCLHCLLCLGMALFPIALGVSISLGVRGFSSCLAVQLGYLNKNTGGKYVGGGIKKCSSPLTFSTCVERLTASAPGRKQISAKSIPGHWKDTSLRSVNTVTVFKLIMGQKGLQSPCLLSLQRLWWKPSRAFYIAGPYGTCSQELWRNASRLCSGQVEQALFGKQGRGRGSVGRVCPQLPLLFQ